MFKFPGIASILLEVSTLWESISNEIIVTQKYYKVSRSPMEDNQPPNYI